MFVSLTWQKLQRWTLRSNLSMKFELGTMINTTKLYSFTPMWTMLTFMKGHTYLKNQNFCSYFSQISKPVRRTLRTTTRHQCGEHCALQHDTSVENTALTQQDTSVENTAHHNNRPVSRTLRTTTRHQC